MNMLLILIFAPLIILFLIVCKLGCDWRSGILTAAIQWGILVVLITEVLSLFKLITFDWLIVLWGLINIILILLYSKILTKENINFDKLRKVRRAEKLSLFPTLLLCSVAFITAAIGLTALVAPPNNWDSMTYHMARIVHWIQNHNVDHYPTNYTPQLYQNPWAEFLIMHFQILSGGDRFANLVQWLSMIGSFVGVSLIAKQLGANLRGQVFSVAVCATIPMGILQGSSTQNDYVLSFWLVCFVYYGLLRAIRKISNNTYLFYIGSSLGLAILTKGTAYIYVFPFLVWFSLLEIKRLNRKAWKFVIIVTIMFIIINFGHYTRNFRLFGSPLGLSKQEVYTNQVFSIQHYISNIFRNLALHLSTPIRSINLLIIEGVRLVHKILGVDINDPRSTFIRGFDLPSLINHEDSAGNLIFLLLIIISSIYLLLFWEKLNKEKYYMASYFGSVISTFLLFTLLLKWQMWHSRLHLPFFVLFSAFVGVILSKCLNQKTANSVVIILILSSLPWVFFNESRPLIINSNFFKSGKIENVFNTSRIEQYFMNRKNIKNDYIKSINFVESKNCFDIGLSLKGDSWEYPFWVLNNKNKPFRFVSVNVKNISAVKSDISKTLSLCAIISVIPEEKNVIFIAKDVFFQERLKSSVKVFIKQSPDKKKFLK